MYYIAFLGPSVQLRICFTQRLLVIRVNPFMYLLILSGDVMHVLILLHGLFVL